VKNLTTSKSFKWKLILHVCRCVQDDNNNHTTRTAAAASDDINGVGAFTRCSSRKSLASNAAMIHWLEAQEKTQRRLEVSNSHLWCDYPLHMSQQPITKLDMDMFHHESWTSIYLEVKGSTVKVTRHEKYCRRGSWHSCECWLLLVTYMLSYLYTPCPKKRYHCIFACYTWRLKQSNFLPITSPDMINWSFKADSAANL